MNPELLKYFASPTAAAEFALLHTEGETRQRLLGVTQSHYKDKQSAADWINSLPKDMSNAAQNEAYGMYAEMTSR